MTQHESEKIFSYGTLQDESVQLSTLGRKLNGSKDVLAGYRVTEVPIENPDHLASGATHYRNIQFTGNASDVVEGIVFSLRQEEFQQVDDYEKDANYARLVVQLNSGVRAWVYQHVDR